MLLRLELCPCPWGRCPGAGRALVSGEVAISQELPSRSFHRRAPSPRGSRIDGSVWLLGGFSYRFANAPAKNWGPEQSQGAPAASAFLWSELLAG